MPQNDFRSRIPGWLADLLAALGLLPLPPDTTPPTISLSAPSTAFTAPGTLNLTPTVSGTVARVEFYQGDVKVGEAFSPPYAFPVTISSSAQAGSYSARAIKLGVPAVASNALGVTVEIGAPADTTAPTLSLSATGRTTAGRVQLTASPFDAVGVVAVTFLRTAPSPVTLGTKTAAPWTFEDPTDLTQADNGTRSYSATAADAAGNNSTAALASAVINIPAPDPYGLTNDGDAFTLTYAPFAGVGTVTGYRTYAMRSADAIARVIVAETPTPAAVVDNTVDDGAGVWYKTFAVVDGNEILRASNSGTQPTRTGWIATQLVITAPGAYVLRHRNTDRTRPAVIVNAGVTGVSLSGLLASRGDGISVGVGAEVTLDNLRAWGQHPGVADSSHGKMLSGSRAAKITVEHCYSENWLFSVYADGQSSGTPTTDLSLFRVRYNRFRNCEGRKTTASGYVQTGDSRFLGSVAHFIQLNGCAGILDAEIAWNEMIQEPDFGFAEDPVNIYNSSCVTGNWGKIHHNLCYGGNAPNEITTRSYAGVGIIFDGQSAKVQFWKAYSNTVTTSNGGVGVAHGYDIDVYDNDAYNAGVLEDGRKIWAVNVGIYAYDYVTADPIKRVKVYGNRSRYYRTPGTSTNPSLGGNPDYGSYYLTKDGIDGSEMAYSSNTDLPLVSDAATRIATERGLYRAWRASAATAGVTLGAA